MSIEETVRDLVRQALDAYVPPPDLTPPKTTSPESPDRANRGAPVECIAVGADHGGFPLKERILRQLTEEGYAVRDCGTNGPAAVDYPDFAHAVARLVASGECRWGIVVDGAGIGSCMAANKVPGVRAALCYDVSSARNSREHNHANVLTLGARMIGEGVALDVVREWLATPWGPGRHAARVEKIAEIERLYLKEREAGS
jgi:ribose 5-phosphate isomerase B